MKEFSPEKTLIIRDLETLRVVADPLRAQILEVLNLEPLTVKQVAEKLGLATSKLYYHINLMEKHGLIKVVDTRIVSGIIEKHYRAAAADLDIDPSLLSFSTDEGKENINTLMTATIDATREDILRSLQARIFDLEQGAAEYPRRVVITRQLSRLPEKRADEFHGRLRALMQEFEQAEKDAPADEALHPYALTIAFYPSFYFREASDANKPDSPEAAPGQT